MRPLRELQRGQEGRLRGPPRSHAEVRPGVRQLLEGGGEEGLLCPTQGCSCPASHLPGGLGGKHQVRAPLRRHQELPLLFLPRSCPAPVLLQGLQDRHVWVSRDSVPLRGENHTSHCVPLSLSHCPRSWLPMPGSARGRVWGSLTGGRTPAVAMWSLSSTAGSISVGRRAPLPAATWMPLWTRWSPATRLEGEGRSWTRGRGRSPWTSVVSGRCPPTAKSLGRAGRRRGRSWSSRGGESEDGGCNCELARATPGSQSSWLGGRGGGGTDYSGAGAGAAVRGRALPLSTCCSPQWRSRTPPWCLTAAGRGGQRPAVTAVTVFLHSVNFPLTGAAPLPPSARVSLTRSSGIINDDDIRLEKHTMKCLSIKSKLDQNYLYIKIFMKVHFFYM